MSAFEGEPARKPERRIGWRGWLVVWALYVGVCVAVFLIMVSAGGGMP